MMSYLPIMQKYNLDYLDTINFELYFNYNAFKIFVRLFLQLCLTQRSNFKYS